MKLIRLTQKTQGLTPRLTNFCLDNTVKRTETDNEKKLKLGIEITDQIKPQSVVDYVCQQDRQYTTNMEYSGDYIHELKFEPYTKEAYIFFQQTNHMQSTKASPDYYWQVSIPNDETFKNKAMGWTYTESRKLKEYERADSLEQAIQICKNNGYTYQIERPRLREFQYKDYGQNFKWKGEPTEEDYEI